MNIGKKKQESSVNSITVVNSARTWIGTPFHLQGRIKNVGCDCIGFILGVAREVSAISIVSKLDLNLYDVFSYHWLKDGLLLKKCIKKHLKMVAKRPIMVGNILLFQFTKRQFHLSIVSEIIDTSFIRIIHSCLSAGKVVEHIMDTTWFNKITGNFVFTRY